MRKPIYLQDGVGHVEVAKPLCRVRKPEPARPWWATQLLATVGGLVGNGTVKSIDTEMVEGVIRVRIEVAGPHPADLVTLGRTQ